MVPRRRRFRSCSASCLGGRHRAGHDDPEGCAADTLIQGDAVRDVALAAKAPGGLALVTNSQWGGWEEDGRQKTTDPGAATVALAKLAPIYR